MAYFQLILLIKHVYLLSESILRFCLTGVSNTDEENYMRAAIGYAIQGGNWFGIYENYGKGKLGLFQLVSMFL